MFRQNLEQDQLDLNELCNVLKDSGLGYLAEALLDNCVYTKKGKLCYQKIQRVTGKSNLQIKADLYKARMVLSDSGFGLATD